MQLMIPFDDTSFHEELDPYCISCRSGDVAADATQPPFFGDKERTYLVIPFVCNECSFGFSVNIKFKPCSVHAEQYVGKAN